MSKKSELIDVELYLIGETEKAFTFTEGGDNAEPFWLPKSQIELGPVSDRDGSVEVVVPRWLAEEKGLV
jgi:hypothetical protein